MNAQRPRSTFTTYNGPERRRGHRYIGEDLTCSIDGRPVTVVDISEGGLRVALAGVIVGQLVDLHMSARDAEPVRTTAKVLACTGGQVSLTFNSPTYALMKFVVSYLANHHGVAVHAFR